MVNVSHDFLHVRTFLRYAILAGQPCASRAEVPVTAYMHAYAIDVAHLCAGEPGAAERAARPSADPPASRYEHLYTSTFFSLTPKYMSDDPAPTAAGDDAAGAATTER